MTKDKANLQRVEYPISAAYCAEWGVVEALRELIANTLDSKAEYGISHGKDTAILMDRGGGFSASCLMLGEGETKSGEQIGQFREGLKLALLTLARLGRSVMVATTEFAVCAAVMEMTGLGREGLVLYVDHTARREIGTEVRVRCTREEFEAARDLFLQLKHNMQHITTQNGDQVFALEPGQTSGSIYVNGLKTDVSGNWRWNYNLQGSESKGAMNRDRTVMSTDVVRHKVQKLWMAVTSHELIRGFIAEMRKGPRDEYHMWTAVGRYSYQLPEAWSKVLLLELNKAAKVSDVSWDQFVRSDGNTLAVRVCTESGFYPVLDTLLGQAFQPLLMHKLQSATNMMTRIGIEAEKKAKARNKRKKVGSYGPYELVDWKDVPVKAVAKLNAAASIVKDVLQRSGYYHIPSKLYSPEYFVYSEDHTGAKSVGCAIDGKVGIKLSHLEDGRVSVTDLVGTTIHELCHLSGSVYADCTREFENIMTGVIGHLGSLAAQSGSYAVIDVRHPPQSKKRVVEHNLCMEDRSFSLNELLTVIEMELSAGRAEKLKDRLELGSTRDQQRASEFAWRYAGVEHRDVRFRKGSALDTTYVFLAQQDSARAYRLDVQVSRRAGKGGWLRVTVYYTWGGSRLERAMYCPWVGFIPYTDVALEEAWPMMGMALKERRVLRGQAAQLTTGGKNGKGKKETK